MKLRDKKSIIIIFGYLVLNAAIISLSLTLKREESGVSEAKKSLAPEYTEIETLEYFHLKDGVPLMSLSAEHMRSQGEEIAEFTTPAGIYNYQQNGKTLNYQAKKGIYKKPKNMLTLEGVVKVTSDEASYFADKVNYYFVKDLIVGKGNVRFEGDDLKTKDHVTVTAASMRAKMKTKFSRFEGGVAGSVIRKRQYEGKMNFSSDTMDLHGDQSLAQLRGNVLMKRQDYLLTAGKADIFLENYNKSLKYFVLNDDVKMREKIRSPEGVITERRAFSERLEGFGNEQKMVLSGAPRVEHGPDVIKGYRITVRENVEMIEVDDAMSDVQVKRKKLKE